VDVNMTRREAIAAATVTGAAVVVGGDLLATDRSHEALAAASCVMTPELTIGPYFVEENLNRSDIRSDSGGASVQDGVKLTLTMNIFNYDSDCAAVSDAKVDIWHCNALGRYSDESANNTSGHQWLRGYQTSDSSGQVTFTTIFPGYYSGRATHIHVRVRVGSTDYTTQIFFTEDQTAAVNQRTPYSTNNSNGTRLKNTDDSIYQQGGSNVLLITPSGDASSALTGELSMGISGGGATATPTPTPTAAPGDTSVDAAFLGVTVARRSGGRRSVKLKITPGERVAVAAKLRRHGHQFAHRFGELGAGTYTVTIKLARSVAAGPARLILTLTDDAGNHRTIHRSLHVPRRRA
jgi:protocatechuate 3,4-dioxygenase beta subunit